MAAKKPEDNGMVYAVPHKQEEAKDPSSLNPWKVRCRQAVQSEVKRCGCSLHVLLGVIF